MLHIEIFKVFLQRTDIIIVPHVWNIFVLLYVNFVLYIKLKYIHVSSPYNNISATTKLNETFRSFNKFIYNFLNLS